MEKSEQRVDTMIDKFILEMMLYMFMSSKAVMLYLACMQKNQQFWAKSLSFIRDWSNKIGVHSVSKYRVWSQAIATKAHPCALLLLLLYYSDSMRITNPPMHFALNPNEFNIHSPLKWLLF